MKKRTRLSLSTTHVILFSFLAVILFGALLLMLPISSRTREWTSFVDALFTSTTATCVTGLVVLPTALALGHCLKVYDKNGLEIGTVRQKLLTFLPKFEIYHGDHYVGCIQKELSFFIPRYHIDYNGWNVEGNFFEWDYSIRDSRGQEIAVVSKELFQWTDTYVIDVADSRDALSALMLVLAIDAEKCSRD